jgi:hypothetical protein
VSAESGIAAPVIGTYMVTVAQLRPVYVNVSHGGAGLPLFQRALPRER